MPTLETTGPDTASPSYDKVSLEVKYLSLSLSYFIQIYLRPQSILNIYGEIEDQTAVVSWIPN